MRYEFTRKGNQIFVLDRTKQPYRPHRSGIVKVLHSISQAKELCRKWNRMWEEFQQLKIVLFRDSDFVISENSTDERWARYNELLLFFNPELNPNQDGQSNKI